MDIVNGTLQNSGVDYNIKDLGTLCNLPKLQRLSPNLIAIEIVKIDVTSGLNMTPSLYVLQFPAERSGKIVLKCRIDLKSEHGELLLFDNKIYYFAEKNRFNRLLEVALENGSSRMCLIDEAPITLEERNSFDFTVSFPTFLTVDSRLTVKTSNSMFLHSHNLLSLTYELGTGRR
jgi:hypothetical protein